MSTKPYNEQTRFEKFMDILPEFDGRWHIAILVVVLIASAPWETCAMNVSNISNGWAQDSIPEEVKPEPKVIPLGQTFAAQINQLMKQQQQINTQIAYLIAGIRDQAGIDTTYKFAGFTDKGQAVYVIPEPKKAVE